jgi:type IV secretory pathway TraG/TraD family ATPase VirD4
MSGIAAACAGIVYTAGLDQCCYLTAPASSHLWRWSLGLLSLGGYESEAWIQYKQYMQSMAAAGHPIAIPLRMAVGAITILGAAAFAGWNFGKPRHSMKFISGNQLLEGNHSKKAASKISGKGIEIAPGFKLTDKKQTEHILIAGGTGSGKSVTGWNILIPAYQRGDRILLVNYKGMTEKFPVRDGAGDAEIMCPWDARSMVWQVSADVTTKTQAQTFSSAMIPESQGNPLWSNAAREVLNGVIMMLIKTRGVGKWGWQDLAGGLNKTQPELLSMMQEHYPQGATFVASNGKATESVLMSLGAFVGVIYDLAEAWGNRKGFSINTWVRNPDSKTKLVILNLSSEFTVLSKAFNVAVLNQIATTISKLPDVPEDKNRFWIYADEFPRLGKLDVWEDFLAVGRSKGFRLVFAFQSLSQLRHIYGNDISETWIDSVGTKILGRQDGKGAAWVSEMAGNARWAIPQRTQSSGSNSSSSFSWSQPTEIPVIETHEVTTKLGAKGAGMRMLVHGITPGFELLIDFPFRKLPDLRAPTRYAKWCREPNMPRSENMTLAPLEIQAEQPADEATKTTVIKEVVTQSTDDFLPPAPPASEPVKEKELDKGEAQKEIANEAAPSIAGAIAGDDVAHLAEAVLKIAGLAEYADTATEAVIQDQPQQITTKRRKLVRKTQESENEL